MFALKLLLQPQQPEKRDNFMISIFLIYYFIQFASAYHQSRFIFVPNFQCIIKESIVKQIQLPLIIL
jgi:hypothetical protein